MKQIILLAAVLAALPLAAGCDDDSVAPGSYIYQLVAAYPNLTFVQPVDFQNAGDGSGRVFVVERRGTVRVFENEASVAAARTFLDVSGNVHSAGLEQGLLGLAFHPDYATNGRFFVYYTVAGGDNRLSRFEVSATNPDSTDQSTETVLMTFTKTAGNHNGGQLAFGPDGFLYVAVGDGGGAGDPNDNAQDLTNVFGTILRLDVDSNSQGNYGIPDTNPFVFNIKGYRPEIYAYGLRNPWRFSFDPVTGRLYAGDVGQARWEEIDIIDIGGNYGWDCFEGAHEYDADGTDPGAPSPMCDTLKTAINPIYEYPHDADGNVSVTGGHVYRGPTITSLEGVYVFADYNTGLIWGIEYDGSSASPVIDIADSPGRISAFGVDEDGELYICDFDPSGEATRVYKLKQTTE